MNTENTLIYYLQDPRDEFFNPRYVGITAKSLHKRLKGHIFASKKETWHVSNWIKLLISENIIPKIILIDEFLSLASAKLYEIALIAKWRVCYKLTNTTDGGDGCLGFIRTESMKEKMSISHLGNKHTRESKLKISISQFKTVYQLDLLGNLINHFDSCIEAEQLTGVQRQLISMCCRKVTKTAKGFMWTYNIDTFIKPNLKRIRTKNSWKMKKISNNIQTWNSIQEACLELKITRPQFNYRLKKKEFTYV